MWFGDIPKRLSEINVYDTFSNTKVNTHILAVCRDLSVNYFSFQIIQGSEIERFCTAIGTRPMVGKSKGGDQPIMEAPIDFHILNSLFLHFHPCYVK
jgi:hypothetical protein